jgi:hypothetical protein
LAHRTGTEIKAKWHSSAPLAESLKKFEYSNKKVMIKKKVEPSVHDKCKVFNKIISKGSSHYTKLENMSLCYSQR